MKHRIVCVYAVHDVRFSRLHAQGKIKVYMYVVMRAVVCR